MSKYKDRHIVVKERNPLTPDALRDIAQMVNHHRRAVRARKVARAETRARDALIRKLGRVHKVHLGHLHEALKQGRTGLSYDRIEQINRGVGFSIPNNPPNRPMPRS